MILVVRVLGCEVLAVELWPEGGSPEGGADEAEPEQVAASVGFAAGELSDYR